jgi:hypothetical protein
MESSHRATTPPPRPPELAGRIGHDVARRVDLDLEPIRAQLRSQLREASDEYIWERAERLAGEAIGRLWSAGLEDQCRHALDSVHEQYLLDAGHCLKTATVLEQERSESWIARAVIHQLAFDAVWDVLGEDELAEELGVMMLEP